MTDATPRQQKLRTSCDRCGAAKLKCDRGQPECGRCLSLGLPCVYGVSRKAGKPPRARHAELRTESSYTTSDHPVGMDVDKPGHSSSSCGSVVLNTGLASAQLPSVNNNNMLWDAVDDNTNTNNNLMTSVDGPDPYGNLVAPSLANFTSLDFDEWVFPNLSSDNLLSTTATPISTSLESGGFSAHAPISAALESGRHSTQPAVKSMTHHLDQSTYIDSSSIAGSRGHDCPREAYSVLGSLSFLSLNQIVPAPPYSVPASASASTSTGTASGVPLDHVLRINREASESLSRLLTCPCARSPHLALLYASIFSRILIWYQQAAGCTQSASWSPAAATLDTALRSASTSTSTSTSRSGSGSSPWLSSAASTISTGCASTPTLSQTTGLAVAPTQMAIGSFNVDDQRVQATFKAQLVSSEMRRAGSVIDLFASESSSGQSSADGCSSGGVDSLYRSLSSWLRSEHSRIAGIMRSKLSELSDNHTLE